MLEPKEKWRNSVAKQMLHAAITAGEVKEDVDIRQLHESHPEYKKWKYSRFRPNLINLFKAIKKGSLRVQKWRKSQAKEILKEAIVSGVVTDDMTAKEVHAMRPEYLQFPIENFTSNFERLREAIKNDFKRMQEDCQAYGHDVGLLQLIRLNENPVPKIPWHKSAAKPLLEEDITIGKHLTTKPKDIYHSRVEYREFSLEEFRNHIYQEVDKRAKEAHRFNKKKTRQRAPTDEQSALEVEAICAQATQEAAV